MAIPMRLNTSGNIIIGPIIKSTDGYNQCTGLTSAAMAIKFFHIGATATGDWSTWSHTTGQLVTTEPSPGYYILAISSNPLSKVGRVRIDIKTSQDVGISFCEEIQVLPANVYDAVLAASGTDYLFVDALQLSGQTLTTDAGANFSTFFDNGGAASTRVVTELSTFTTALTVSANIIQISSQALTTEAGANWNYYYDNNSVVSTNRVSDIVSATPSTVTPLNIGAISSVALTTQAGANWQLFFNVAGAVTTAVLTDVPTTSDVLTTASNVNIGAAAGTTIAGATAFRSTFSTAALVNVGAIGGATVATGTAQLGVNVVSLSSHAITSDAGDNFDRFFDNGGVVTTEVLGDLPTTADLLTTASSMSMGAIAGTTITTNIAQLGVNVVEIADETVTTDAADNWDNYWFNNDVVSTERVSELPTTSDLLTTSDELDLGAVKGAALTTIGGDNFSTYIDNGGAAATAQLGAQSTFGMLDTVDGMTFLEYSQYAQAYITGDFKVTGAATNQMVYDKFGGATFFSHTLTTVLRTFTSN